MGGGAVLYDCLGLAAAGAGCFMFPQLEHLVFTVGIGGGFN